MNNISGLAKDVRADLQQAISTVNDHAGQTCIYVQFSDDPTEIDFIANSARITEGGFEFQAGIETLTGAIEEIAAIRTEVIH